MILYIHEISRVVGTKKYMQKRYGSKTWAKGLIKPYLRCKEGHIAKLVQSNEVLP